VQSPIKITWPPTATAQQTAAPGQRNGAVDAAPPEEGVGEAGDQGGAEVVVANAHDALDTSHLQLQWRLVVDGQPVRLPAAAVGPTTGNDCINSVADGGGGGDAPPERLLPDAPTDIDSLLSGEHH
jgi:hypothetical protein